MFSKDKRNLYFSSLAFAEASVLAMFTISIEIHFTIHFTWRILERERSRWAKERRQERAKARKGAKPLYDLHRKVGQSVTSKQKVIFKLNNIRLLEKKS